jgi:hypothetical protein
VSKSKSQAIVYSVFNRSSVSRSASDQAPGAKISPP